MPVNCKLCGEALGASDGPSRCRCGWRIDDGCRDDHGTSCPVQGSEPWVGVQEF